jgi:prophage DNA circulation protein
MAEKPTCASLKATADLQAYEMKALSKAGDANSEKVEKLREKVEEVKTDHGGELKSLRADVDNLKDEVKFWKRLVGGLIVTIIGALILSAAGVKK